MALWVLPNFSKLLPFQGGNHNANGKHDVFARQTIALYAFLFSICPTAQEFCRRISSYYTVTGSYDFDSMHNKPINLLMSSSLSNLCIVSMISLRLFSLTVSRVSRLNFSIV